MHITRHLASSKMLKLVQPLGAQNVLDVCSGFLVTTNILDRVDSKY